jgi:hypothetical protein
VITKGGIVVIVEALVIEMTLKITVLALKRKETLYRLNVGKVLICRGNNTSLRSTLDRCLDILEQQNKTSLFDEADRERKRLAPAQVVFYFIEECYLGVVC